jgi:hypothetical protein
MLTSESQHDVAGALDRSGHYPNHPDGEYLTEFEQDCRDWGLAFGFAYGVARGEDPFESNDDVLARALLAAEDAFARWNDGSDIFTTEAYDKDRATRPVPNEIEVA